VGSSMHCSSGGAPHTCTVRAVRRCVEYAIAIGMALLSSYSVPEERV
jgi:hypothetical protein